MGYKVQHKILNSAWYGAATKRERLIIVATRGDLEGEFHYPLPTHYDESIDTKLDFNKSELEKCKFKKPLSVKEALVKIDYDNKEDLDNQPMQHNVKTIERFKHIKAGCNISDSIESLPKDLQIYKFFSRGSNMCLHFDRLVPTLVAVHSAFPLHPK